MAIEKKITVTPGANPGEFKFDILAKYWDGRKYKMFGNKDRVSLYYIQDIVDMFDEGNGNGLAYIMRLLANIDKDNMVGVYKKSSRVYAPVNSREKLYNLLKITRRNTGAAFYKKLKSVNFLKEYKDSENGTVYFVNPVYTMRDKGITLLLYKLFFNELNEVLPWQTQQGLQKLCSDTSNDNSTTVYVDDNLQIAGYDYDKIFQDTILNGEAPDTYIKNDFGMIRGMSADNINIWFTPNKVRPGASRTAANVTEYRNLYLDIDAETDDLQQIGERKAKMRDVIATLPTPSAVVETCHGYHVYFSLQDGVTADEWRSAERKLLSVVSIADRKASDPSRLLRLPGTVHKKPATEPFNVTIVSATPVRYSLGDLNTILDNTAETITATCLDYEIMFPSTKPAKKTAAIGSAPAPAEQTARIEAIKALSTDTFVIPLNAREMTIAEAKSYYLTQIDLREFLNLPGYNFSCIFHADSNPSATIYAPDSEHSNYRYYCGSSNCTAGGKALDIINCICLLANCDYVTAVKYLAKISNIKIVATQAA